MQKTIETPEADWITTNEAAQILGFKDRRRIQQMVQEGKLIGWKPSRNLLLISRQSVMELKELRS